MAASDQIPTKAKRDRKPKALQMDNPQTRKEPAKPETAPAAKAPKIPILCLDWIDFAQKATSLIVAILGAVHNGVLKLVLWNVIGSS